MKPPCIDSSETIETVKRFWGFDTLRPLQEEAIQAGLQQRDSLLVMPTGGGKSLCYQVPPALVDRTDIVVSPLISLMKDQVDGLRACGYPAAAIHGNMTSDDVRRTEAEVASGKYRLVFVSPERLMAPRFLGFVEKLNVSAFAIDEAHCISHWGHDFRPEYRQLAMLKRRFPRASVHAFTATATRRVREDIVAQLGLANPLVLVGNFDRPNLIYRIIQRVDVYQQVAHAIGRHKGEAVIVYCISRKDTEELAEYLRTCKINAEHYHAGIDAAERRRVQEAFAEDRLDVVVATVAFGMGIDRSNVRCVIHAAMPKSIEHYQQETGRAGRDGLEAECILFYSGADVIKWESLIERSAEEADNPHEIIEAMGRLLRHIQQYCSGMRCRHRSLTEYFGQLYEKENCGACDVCLEEMEPVPDATVLSQKILSCVARVEQRFGAGYVVDVLIGAQTEQIRHRGHDQLSTYGLLKGEDKKRLTSFVHQLVDQGLLARSSGEYPVLQLNDGSWAVMRGRRDVKLLMARAAGVKKTKIDENSWEGVDRGLFDALRRLRMDEAQRRAVPAYVIFSDNALRGMARRRPSSLDSLSRIKGVGEQKLDDFGSQFVSCIKDYCGENDLVTDVEGDPTEEMPPPARKPGMSKARRMAIEMFVRGASVEEVMQAADRARSTVFQYLCDYIEQNRPANVSRWIDDASYAQIAPVVREVGFGPLRPIFERFDGKIPYEAIRLVMTHLRGLDKESR